ncbi:MAG: hypothetical protein H6710_02820 [Myxococcales bacterium]|nr:hypothetical protein [Myxococcales bacterium]MCB9704001.1 hypothetical protein [Myxococcales bacterium]
MGVGSRRGQGRGWGARVLALGLALAASACASKVDESELRVIWVPREVSHGLQVDDETSRVPAPHVRPGEAPRGATVKPLLKAER